MNLSNLFRLHALLALPYALFLILLPRVMIDLMSEDVLNPIGANIARLMGAALILVAQLREIWGAWGWLNVASYALFVIGYGYYLFIGEDEIARSA